MGFHTASAENNLSMVEDPALRSDIAGHADIVQAGYDKFWSYWAIAKMFDFSWVNPTSLPQKIDDLQLGNMLLGFEGVVNPNDLVPNVVGSLPVTSVVWDKMTDINIGLSTGGIQLYLVDMFEKINMEDHRLYRYIQRLDHLNTGRGPRVLAR